MTNKEIDIQCAFLDVAIMRQLFYCKNKNLYSAGIYVSEKCHLLFDRLDNLISDCNMVINRKVKMMNEYEIIFKNGSSIILLNANNNLRGYKINDVIIDTSIEGKIKDLCYYTHFPYRADEDDKVDIGSRCVELEIPKNVLLSRFRYDVWR